MKKILSFFFLICFASVFNGCTKYDDLESATTLLENGVGFIKMVSQSNNPYEIYIDDVLQGSIQGHENKTYSVSANETHVVYVKQATGYVLWPTTETYNVTVGIAQTYTLNFPVSSMGKNVAEEE